MAGKYTEAQKNASIKYLKEKTDDIRIRVPKGKKEQYKKLADTLGISLNQLIIDCLEEKMKK